jgi:hypothetical protein
LTFTFPITSNNDFAGYRVWISTTNGFAPNSTSLVDGGNFAWQGVSNISPSIFIPGLLPNPTYYVRFAEIDVLSKNVLDCNISAQITIAT